MEEYTHILSGVSLFHQLNSNPDYGLLLKVLSSTNCVIIKPNLNRSRAINMNVVQLLKSQRKNINVRRYLLPAAGKTRKYYLTVWFSYNREVGSPTWCQNLGRSAIPKTIIFSMCDPHVSDLALHIFENISLICMLFPHDILHFRLTDSGLPLRIS